eukprot:13669859-Alexandrium_andersonii.AAC.1
MDDQAAGQIRLRSQSPLKSHGVSQAGGSSKRTKAPAANSTPPQSAPWTTASGRRVTRKALWRAPARAEGASAGAAVGA